MATCPASGRPTVRIERTINAAGAAVAAQFKRDRRQCLAQTVRDLTDAETGLTQIRNRSAPPATETAN